MDSNITITEVNYDGVFIKQLLSQVEGKIALVSNKDYKNNVYNLGHKNTLHTHSNLIDMRNILDKILECNSCYEDFNIEDVISTAKNLINKC